MFPSTLCEVNSQLFEIYCATLCPVPNPNKLTVKMCVEYKCMDLLAHQ